MTTLLRTQRLLATACLLSLAALACVASAEPQIRETHIDWTIVCDEPPQLEQEICLMVQQKNLKDSNQPVIRIEIGYSPQNGKPLLLATVATTPLGITLPHGLEMQVDQLEPVRYQFGSCIGAGCVVGTNLNNKLLADFKLGVEAKFSFLDTQGRRITVPISLNGFTAAFDAVGK